ncbi:MAG: M15 family metallopeptidase [Clostridia bacterium]|nr:M15 family metallopeptidase [Clostridia bacterium]
MNSRNRKTDYPGSTGYLRDAGRGGKPSRRWVFPLVLIILAVIILVAVISAASGRNSGTAQDPSGENLSGQDGTRSDPPGEDTADPGGENVPEYRSLSVSSSEIYTGDLILVNSEYEYHFPENQEIVNIYEYKTDDYKLASITLRLDRRILELFNGMLADFASTKGRRDVIINSGYRDASEQQEIYESRKQAYGQQYADAYVQKPGFSEHHTGFALDMAVYTDSKVSMTFDQDEDFDWFMYASHTHGFILRYASHKSGITGISAEPWHFRYVGVPHAYYMYANDLCLEEYIDLLRNYSFESEHLVFRDDEETLWEVYYIPSSGSDRTELHVPASREYSVSGNNVDGFIVTARKTTT